MSFNPGILYVFKFLDASGVRFPLEAVGDGGGEWAVSGSGVLGLGVSGVSS